MKKYMNLMISIFGLFILFAFSINTAIPADKMPESENVKVLIENDDVRVAEAIRPPGTMEPMHTHPAYVAYFFGPWKGRLTSADGKVTEKEFEGGSVIYSPGVTHAVEVIGTTEQHVLVIEWKKK